MTNAALAPPAPPDTYVFLGPNLPTTARIARDWLVGVLRGTGHHELAEAARLCTSEVVTNVHVHARTTPQIIVEARVAEQWVLVVVYDNRPHPVTEVELGPASPDDEHGRGLALVDSFADSWGVSTPRRPIPIYGGPAPMKKAVWFRLSDDARGEAA
ncbi:MULTISPECIES: ATP-binding protein [unclassified Streptomyces]|uniref:ATP-binding protein n=1 Tax=unclassified Streptomyces TaxID=2593676 RepID=UPI00099BEE6C|nr:MULTISPECIES: ATP-binding protein [unclassified Streptomyces]